jgi:hypothetical protein
MGLLIPYAPRIEADVEFAIKGGKVTGVPPAIEIESKSGGFERKTVASGASSLKLAYRSWLKPGVYEPKEYPRLTEFVQKVAAAERAVVQVAGARSGRSR